MSAFVSFRLPLCARLNNYCQFLCVNKVVSSSRFFKMLVNVTEGTLRGEKLKNTLTSDEFYSFKGIPFAKPPVGPLRFKNPVPPEKYEGVWDATQERSMCVQKGFHNSEIGGDEDCLYLNVYTPKLPEERSVLKPVMFYLYGGGCTEGQKDAFLYGPDFLVAKDVVLVIPNYRLHILGFLNLGIEECPGNVGFKDQVAALKWTKQNIKQFGGDPDNITIFGESAGAVSVLYLLYSPLSSGKGLFHKAIVQSGNIMYNRSVTTVESSTERASRAAEKLGFKSKNPRELYNFLMKVPAPDLTRHALGVLTHEERDSGILFPFSPCVEVVGPPNERMIVAKGSELMKQDPGVPVMDGLCSQEAILSLKALLATEHPAEVFISRMESLIIPRLFGDLVKDDETKKNVINKFKQFYFSGKSTDEEIKLAALDLFGDVMYNRGFHDSIKAFLENSSQPVYSYLFSYRATLGILEYIFHKQRPSFLKGAGHTDELGYLFSMQLTNDKVTLGKTERKIIELMTTIWTNFAKYSNPGKSLPVDIKPVTATDKTYLDINEEPTIKPGLIFEERMKFIDDIYTSLTAEQACCIRKK